MFYSELNDTVVEAQLRTSRVPPELPQKDAIERYLRSNNRLLILVCYVWSEIQEFCDVAAKPFSNVCT